MKTKKWTKVEEDFLKENYSCNGRRWCMKELDRSEPSVRQKTSRLKLKLNQSSQFWKDFQKRAAKGKIGNKHSKKTIEKMKKSALLRDWEMSKEGRNRVKEGFQRMLKEKGHPKGFKGKHHSTKMKKAMSVRVKNEWADTESKFNSKEFKQRQSKNQSERMIERLKNKGSIYSRANAGWYIIDGVKGKHYFRSGWEVVYARHLQWLFKNGKIEKWEYEPKVFLFNGSNNGVRSYTPDFKVYYKNKIEFHEVKGYLDEKAKMKTKMMLVLYPKITLKTIDKKVYSPIEKVKDKFPSAKKVS